MSRATAVEILLAGRVRQVDIGLCGKRLRLWRRDAGFFLWRGLRLLRLRLALLAFTLGIQDITDRRNLLRFPYETLSTHRSLPGKPFRFAGKIE